MKKIIVDGIEYNCLTDEELSAMSAENDVEKSNFTKAFDLADALSFNYLNAYLVDKQNRTAEIIKLNGYVTQGLDKTHKGPYPYDVVVNNYIQNRVAEQSKPFVTKALDWETVLEEVQQHGTYSFTYKVMDHGEEHEYEGRFHKIDDRYIASGFQNIDDIVAAEKKRNEKLQTLNDQLQENQKLLEEERARVADAYGMFYGLSQEYHTIWVVSKVTSMMRLIRTTGVSTIKNAVQMGKDYPEFDVFFERYINTYVEPEDRERMFREIAFAEIQRQLEKGGLYAVNYLRRDESGHVGYHQIAFANADTEDGKKQFVYGFRDIDKLLKYEMAQKEELRKAKEDADAANRAKTSFLYNMSHDMRTPMNAIIGFANLAEKHRYSPDMVERYVSKITSASDYLLSLINNVLDMARIDSGKTEVNEEFYDVLAPDNNTNSLFEVLARDKHIDFSFSDDVKHRYVMLDKTKIRQIMVNLLSNAIKYTPDGGKIHYSFSEIPCDREGYVTYVSTVSDTGIGMTPEFAKNIYEMFSRERNTTSSKIQGTGLGMSIVKRLVDMMGGTIELQTELGKGTTFTVTLTHPVVTNPEKYLANNTTENSKANISLKGKRILLAEDNDLNSEIATDALEEAGMEVDCAEDGKICCQKLADAESGYYDLILMDIQMPYMNGYEATKFIRRMSDTAKANIPIIAMTANAFEEDKRAALDAGMNAYLAKPIKAKTLIKEIATILR